jgi:hypothetical protein
MLPHVDGGVCIRISDDIHSVLGPTEEDIYAVRGLEKTNLLCLVASHQRYDNDLGFFSLEVVDCCDSKEVRKLLLFKRFSALFRCCSDSLVLRSVADSEAIFLECFFVAFA